MVGGALLGAAANRQVCPTISEMTFGNQSMCKSHANDGRSCARVCSVFRVSAARAWSRVPRYGLRAAPPMRRKPAGWVSGGFQFRIARARQCETTFEQRRSRARRLSQTESSSVNSLVVPYANFSLQSPVAALCERRVPWISAAVIDRRAAVIDSRYNSVSDFAEASSQGFFVPGETGQQAAPGLLGALVCKAALNSLRNVLRSSQMQSELVKHGQAWSSGVKPNHANHWEPDVCVAATHVYSNCDADAAGMSRSGQSGFDREFSAFSVSDCPSMPFNV